MLGYSICRIVDNGRRNSASDDVTYATAARKGEMNIKELMGLYYRLENAVTVSPHGLRKRIAAGDDDFLLVDLRSRLEYEQSHIVGARSIPAYSSPDTPAYEQHERIVSAFGALGVEKEIIVYCYSKACMSGKKIGVLLADHDIFVKHLGIGWNEWRHAWQSWNHEHEWPENSAEEYIASGPEPGRYSGTSTSGPIHCEC